MRETPSLVARLPATASAGQDQKCVTVVFNPVSGQGDPEERKRRIEEALARHGYRCQHLVTTPQQDARYFTREALRDGVDLIAVSGGDGTVIEAMSALTGTDVPIAIFPAGTGNLMAVNLALPMEGPQAVHAALFGQKRALDLGRITTDSGEIHYFAIMAGAGYAGKVIQDAKRDAKQRLGLLAYLWAAIKNLRHRPVLVRIRLDDQRAPLVRRANSVLVANMGRFQGGLSVVPGAWPDDGLLEVAVVKAETLLDWLRLLWSALRGRLHEQGVVDYYRVRRAEVEFSFPQPFQYDGEDGGQVRGFTAEVIPGAVQVMVPREAPV